MNIYILYEEEIDGIYVSNHTILEIDPADYKKYKNDEDIKNAAAKKYFEGKKIHLASAYIIPDIEPTKVKI